MEHLAGDGAFDGEDGGGALAVLAFAGDDEVVLEEVAADLVGASGGDGAADEGVGAGAVEDADVGDGLFVVEAAVDGEAVFGGDAADDGEVVFLEEFVAEEADVGVAVGAVFGEEDEAAGVFVEAVEGAEAGLAELQAEAGFEAGVVGFADEARGFADGENPVVLPEDGEGVGERGGGGERPGGGGDDVAGFDGMAGHPDPLAVDEDVAGVDEGFGLSPGEIEAGFEEILEGGAGVIRAGAEGLEFWGHGTAVTFRERGCKDRSCYRGGRLYKGGAGGYGGGMSAPEWRKAVHCVNQLSLPGGRRALGLFTLEGYRSLERAFRNGAPLEAVLVGEEIVARETERNVRIVAETRSRGLPLHVVPDGVMAELTRGRGLGAVFAILRRPAEPELAELVRAAGRTLVVVGWNLGDPGNTGAVIRSALAAGAAGFVAVGTTDPWHPKAVRTSMGSLFALPVLEMAEAEGGWLEVLHGLGFETVASVCRDAEPLNRMEPCGVRTALVMGSEAFGLPEALAGRMRRRVTIPMPAGVDSYSINAAAAVLAYTLMQQPV